LSAPFPLFSQLLKVRPRYRLAPYPIRRWCPFPNFLFFQRRSRESASFFTFAKIPSPVFERVASPCRKAFFSVYHFCQLPFRTSPLWYCVLASHAGVSLRRSDFLKRSRSPSRRDDSPLSDPHCLLPFVLPVFGVSCSFSARWPFP